MSICMILTMIVLMLLFLGLILVIVKFSQQEQKEILNMFSVTDCNHYTPTTEQMDHLIFKIFMVANIIMTREKRLPEHQRFFRHMTTMGKFFKNTMGQQHLFNWKEMVEKMGNSFEFVKDLFKTIKMRNNIPLDPVAKIFEDRFQNASTVDPDFEYEVSRNMVRIVESNLPDKYYEPTTNLNVSYHFIKQLMNENHCYCRQTNPFLMLINKPSDFKYCESMSWLLVFNSGTTLIGALLILLTNVILQKSIMFMFDKIPFVSRSRKATYEVLVVSLALFFNTLVILVNTLFRIVYLLLNYNWE